MRTAYDMSELDLVRSALARALHEEPPDLGALNAALRRVDKLLGRGPAQPSAAATARPALPVARGFFAG